MGKSLVIVESPKKAKTINKFLGKEFVVKASYGHVRDLPKSDFGISIKKNFEPDYQVLPEKKKVVAELKKAAKEAESIFLACDLDREGEAIAWHIRELLGAKVPTHRVTFNEITQTAIDRAFREAGDIDMAKVNAQQARRILDRLVGYLLSPLLWEKVTRGLSAGRVQSVAVRLIVEREAEIRAFKPEEYWRIEATLAPVARPSDAFFAELKKLDGHTVAITNQTDAEAAGARLRAAPYRILSVERKEKADKPLPPFVTSTLQQQAAIRLRFSTKRTMRIAQDLYEGVEIGDEGATGLITYMRTDSFNIAKEAIDEVRGFVGETFGARYVPEKPNAYAAKKGAQEAHEAIRPTSVLRTPEAMARFLDADQLRLYRLIWERFVASQMTPAIYALTTVDAGAGEGEQPFGLFRAVGKTLVFDGHARVSGVKASAADASSASGEEDVAQPVAVAGAGEGEGDAGAGKTARKGEAGAAARERERILPPLAAGEALALLRLQESQHFTQPPPRFNEASLVQTLEKRGIGRPSTYAQIISTIQDREYVEQKDRRFYATALGEIVTDRLVKHFSDVLDPEFTSRMEGRLDEVEESGADWLAILRDFYGAFERDLKLARRQMRGLNENPEPSEVVCEACQSPMVYKYNSRDLSRFLACTGYPKCKKTLPVDEEGEPLVPEETDEVCSKCGSSMVIRQGRRGKFLACSAYPQCENRRSLDGDGLPVAELPPVTAVCEQCGKTMVAKLGKRGPFLACTGFPACKNARPLPGDGTPEGAAAEGGAAAAPGEAPPPPACDKCGKPMTLRRGRRGMFYGCTGYPECRGTKQAPGGTALPGRVKPEPTDIPCDQCGKMMVIRSGRRGRFLGCSGYPRCRNARPLPGEEEGGAQPAVAKGAPAAGEADPDAPAKPAARKPSGRHRAVKDE